MTAVDPDPSGVEPAEISLARQIRQRLEALQRAGIDLGPMLVAEISEPAEAVPASVQIAVDEPAGFTPRMDHVDQSSQPKTSPRTEPPVLPRPSSPKTTPKTPPSQVPAAETGTLFGDTAFDTPPVPASDRPDRLLEIAQIVAKCPKCPVLSATRTQTVFGDGSPTARLMFIGEAPGAEEDRRGIPFVGRAGQLLTDMITKGMGLRREDVYIANILKCRPPDNRDPLPDECANCMPYLERQLEIIRPEYLCLLGRVAAQNLLKTTVAMGKLRGRWHSVRGIKAIVTYHPSYLLRNPPAKKDAWEDLQIIMREMGLQIPSRNKQ